MISIAPLWPLDRMLSGSPHCIAGRIIAKPCWDVDNTTAAALSREIRQDGQPQGAPPVDITRWTVIMSIDTRRAIELESMARIHGLGVTSWKR
jgi:hypothetical protein